MTSTNISLAVLPSMRKKPRLECLMASDTARFAALVASLPWTSTPMPISVTQRTRAMFYSCGWLGEGVSAIGERGTSCCRDRDGDGARATCGPHEDQPDDTGLSRVGQPILTSVSSGPLSANSYM